MPACGKIFMFPKIEKAKHPLTITLKTHPSPMNTIRHHLLNASRQGTAVLALACIAAMALSTAQAQTTRTWTGSTDNRYNDIANWNPSAAWANGDTLRFNGTQAGNLDLIYTGGQNTGVLLDFTAAQTGTVGISLASEASQSRNFRLANATNTSAITIAAGAGKVTLNGQSETFRMGALFGPSSDPGVGQTIFINNAGTLEFGAFTTLTRAQFSRGVDLILLGGGQTTILGRVDDFGGFGGIRVDQNSLLTLSGAWVANTRLMIDQGRTDFTSAAAIGGNQTTWNSIRIGNNVSTGIGTLRYTGTGDVQVDRRIQIGNGANVNQTGSAIIENTSATGKLVFGNSIFNADGADPLSFGNAGTAAARTLTLGGNNTLANEITGQIINNSANGTIGVIKEGDGRWILSGNNTYTGNTMVNAGTLLINGSTAVGSAVTVANSAVIGGNGTINGNLTLQSGARFGFDTTNTAFTLTLVGTLTLDNSFGVASLRNLDGTAIAWDTIALNTTYTLLDTSFAFDANNIQNFGFANRLTGLAGGREAYFQDGSLQLVVIPEPSTWALLAVSLAALVIFRRRRGTC